MLKYFIWPLWCSFKMRRVANGRRSHANRRPARTHSCQSFCGPFSMPLIFKEYNRTFISDIWLSIRYKNMPPAMSRRRLNAKEKEKKCFGASKYVSTNWLIILTINNLYHWACFEQSYLVGIVCWEWQPLRMEAQALINWSVCQIMPAGIEEALKTSLNISVAESEVAKLWDGRRGLVSLRGDWSRSLAYHCLPRQRLLLHSMKNLCAVHSEDCSVHSNSHA